MDQHTHDVRRANWFNIIAECQQRPINVSVKQGKSYKQEQEMPLLNDHL